MRVSQKGPRARTPEVSRLDRPADSLPRWSGPYTPGVNVTPPPPARQADPEARLRGLSTTVAANLRRARQAMQAGDAAAAELAVLAACTQAPAHPESLRWAARVDLLRGCHAQAAARIDAALAQWPADPELLLDAALMAHGRDDDPAVMAFLLRARDAARDTALLLRVAIESDRLGHDGLAAESAAAALARAPGMVPALLQRGRSLNALGRVVEATAAFRAVLGAHPDHPGAWFSLLEQKTVRLTPDELGALERAEANCRGDDEDRCLLGFALGRALEDAGRHADAFAALGRANALARRVRPWDAAAFSRQVDAVLGAFDAPVAAAASARGAEVLFVVGLPRSGTTLIEQVLAAHPQVEGASELPYLYQVVDAQSRRRGIPFPEWVATATPADWDGMGADYLRRSARWRERKPTATDKMPANWLLAGAALAMLPGTRVVALHRDPLETAWSCYKQYFARDLVGFAYDFGDIAAYWRDYERATRRFTARFPDRFRIQRYEDFVDDPEGQTRELLAFCGLPFDPACLRFHEAERSVRTASAAQVRQPLRRDTARTAAYGALLDPLRALLGRDRDPP